jgi:hypothetical protein
MKKVETEPDRSSASEYGISAIWLQFSYSHGSVRGRGIGLAPPSNTVATAILYGQFYETMATATSMLHPPAHDPRRHVVVRIS